MDTRDRDAISGLFSKLREVERQAGPRDSEAERLITEESQRLQGAPYYMAQTIVMQDMALNAKQGEVDELKRRLAESAAQPERPAEGGGFLSRVFGNGPSPSTPQPQRPAAGPWGAAYGNRQSAPQYAEPPTQYAPPPPQYAQAPQQYAPQGGGFGRGMGGGGGFLAGAAQTAMGVAGGVVLGNAIGSFFGGHHGGLFGGGDQPTEIVNETTNIYEGAPENDVREASDGGSYADDNSQDDGYQDASYDDGGDFSDDGSDQI